MRRGPVSKPDSGFQALLKLVTNDQAYLRRLDDLSRRKQEIQKRERQVAERERAVAERERLWAALLADSNQEDT